MAVRIADVGADFVPVVLWLGEETWRPWPTSPGTPAAGCTVRLGGRTYRATSPHLVPWADDRALIASAFNPMLRAGFRLLGMPEVYATAWAGLHQNGATVLTNGRGLTLYWFAPDTPARSACTGACAQYWPPVTGPATAGQGVTGRLGTITRPDGTAHATYDGHPLYTYIADIAPGQAHGDNLNLNGGLWHEVTVTR
jgi:predicted lipoprotein with Yx(FWY)xxD motif